MNSKFSDLLKVQSLRDGETCQINWHEGGGGEVTREGDICPSTKSPNSAANQGSIQAAHFPTLPLLS